MQPSAAGRGCIPDPWPTGCLQPIAADRSQPARQHRAVTSATRSEARREWARTNGATCMRSIWPPALSVAAYALSPIDLIPDFIPVVGDHTAPGDYADSATAVVQT